VITGAQTIEHERVTIQLPCTSGELAQALGAELIGAPTLTIERPGAVEDDDPAAVCFVRDKSYAAQWARSRCAAVIVSRGVELEHDDARAVLVVEDADEAYTHVLRAHDPGRARPEPGIDPRANVNQSAGIHPTAAIAPGCVVGPRAVIGEHAVLMPNAVIGADVVIGHSTTIESGVVIEDRVLIGARCVIGANSVIGADGFGYLPPNDKRPAVKVPQTGSVVIADEVEIGACVTVDRGKLHDTTIGARVKIDNQVHVGHNSAIGADTIICGRTTLGGSCTLGKRVMVGGAVTFNDHASTGDDARVAGGAIVVDHVPQGESYAGIPAHPARLALSNYAAVRELGPTLRKIEKRLRALEPDES
jgi:UDP-3-O-[3-hydroxymyristoyl] glucosamine N-acyltransferase